MKRFMAFDGGGTSTRAGLYDQERNLLAEAEAGPSNPIACGVDHCVDTLAGLGHKLLKGAPGRLTAAIAALSGAGRPALRRHIASALSKRLNADTVLSADDLHPILLANGGRGPAILAVAGTGSAVLAQAEGGSRLRIGGLGRIFGDEGGAYQVAVSALRAAGYATDKMGPPTRLAHALVKAARVRAFRDLPGWAESAAKSRIADLARTVVRVAEEGDAVARECVVNQAERLADQVVAAASRLSIPVGAPVYVIGGLVERSRLFREAFEATLAEQRPGTRLVTPALRGHRAVVELAFIEPVPADIVACVRRPGTQGQRRL